MGQIRKRGNIYWIRYYRDGQRFEESAKTAVYDDAKKLLQIKEGDIAHGIPVTRTTIRFTFDDAAADLLTEYRMNGRQSIANVTKRIAYLTTWFRGRRFTDLTTAQVRAYAAHRQEAGAAAATINRELAALKRMFTLAIQDGKVHRRPHIPMLREDNVRRGFFERDAFEQVRRHLPKALRGIATVAYFTGWRTQSEILTLQWPQIDRVAGTLRLEPGTTKNREGRVFLFAELTELRDAIEEQWRAHVALARKGVICPWVFQRRGRPVRYVRRAWKTACRKAGCPGRILHDFRRTAVRNLIRAGVPDTIAMKVTGHKTRAVFDRYDITSEEDLAEASRKLQRLATSQGQSAGTVAPTADRGDAGSVKTGAFFAVAGGDPGGDRTHDPVIKSHMLYH